MGAGWNKGIDNEPLCKHCGENDRTKFYGKMKTTCKPCQAKIQYATTKANRVKAIEAKGGKCEHCGYDRYSGALEFHHLDPTQKDPTGLRKHNFEALMKEVDKCILLCSNCHREEHGRLTESWPSQA